MNKEKNIVLEGTLHLLVMAIGMIMGLGLVIISKPIALKIYGWLGINEPSNIILSALFECSLYLPAVLGAIALAYGVGLLIKRALIQQDATKRSKED